jgi:hypothetical protein
MASSPTKRFRVAPLQRLTVRPIEDPAEQAALDERLKRAQAAITGDSTPADGIARVQADADNPTNAAAGVRKGSEAHGLTRSRTSGRRRRR